MDVLTGVITGVRNIRGEMNVPPSSKVNLVIDAGEDARCDLLTDAKAHLLSLAKAGEVTIGQHLPKPAASATAVIGSTQVHVLLRGLLDFGEEKERLRKKILKAEKDLEAAEKKLRNPNFREKAPAEIVAEVREKVEAAGLQLEKLRQNLAFFASIEGEEKA